MASKEIIIADDHSVFREGMVHLFRQHFPDDRCREAADGKELLRLVERQTPDLIILDLYMPEMDGIEVAKQLTRSSPSIKILVLTFFTDTVFIEELLQIGVNGILSKDAERKEIAEAIIKVREGGNYYNQGISEIMHQKLQRDYQMVHDFRLYERFNPKEIQVLKLLCEEKTTREIARIIDMKVRTVENYRRSLLEKTGAKNSIGLIRFAIKSKILEL
ncbi:response regulator transcription factor [Tunicatimonas pelagia]|uniref:response regulator transcription factor n=1 Tax=Tunicatimonas pelagia TaxID=931531 RepID=UPI002665A4EE|nr:response regulator transcription factor [Tunicatimonas pelagia]WKN44581.1 response regulator transcription factor [Tunicatimonas pelagia]